MTCSVHGKRNIVECDYINHIRLFSCDEVCKYSWYDVSPFVYFVVTRLFSLTYLMLFFYSVVISRRHLKSKSHSKYKLLGSILINIILGIRSFHFMIDYGHQNIISNHVAQTILLRLPQVLAFDLIIIQIFIWCDALGILQKKLRIMLKGVFVVLDIMLLCLLCFYSKVLQIILGCILLLLLGVGFVIGIKLYQNIQNSEQFIKEHPGNDHLINEIYVMVKIRKNILRIILLLCFFGFVIFYLSALFTFHHFDYPQYVGAICTYHVIELFLFFMWTKKIFYIKKILKRPKARIRPLNMKTSCLK